MNSIKLPLTFSLVGHAACLALLVLFLQSRPAPVPEPVARGGIEVVFAPALPQSETAPPSEPPVQPETPPPPVETPPPEPQIEAVPPMPEPALVASEPTPSPPLHKPTAKRLPKPAPRHNETAQPNPAAVAPAQTAPAAVVAPPQTASAATPVPAPLPSPEASAGYAALLSDWLNRHKHYPESARQRGEEGIAVLRFEVERNGRILQYAVVKSSGFSDLDASIEEMMRGAILPPFPAGLTDARKEYTVKVRFRLER